MSFPATHYPKIEELRASFGTPKLALAKHLSVSYTTFLRKLSGDRDFTLTEAILIADLWGLSLDELIGREPPPIGTYTVVDSRLSYIDGGEHGND